MVLTMSVAIVASFVLGGPVWACLLFVASFCGFLSLSISDPKSQPEKRVSLDVATRIGITLLASPILVNQAVICWQRGDIIMSIANGAAAIILIPFCIKKLIGYFRPNELVKRDQHA